MAISLFRVQGAFSRNRTIVGLKRSRKLSALVLTSVSQSHHSGIETGEKALRVIVTIAGRNRTIVGLKPDTTIYTKHNSLGRNRTIVGLKRSADDEGGTMRKKVAIAP